MAETRLTVAFAGPHVSIQDGGRSGHLRFGVPRSGPMDRPAAAIANAALGNAPDAPLIEVSMGGLSLDCAGSPVSLAVAGGGFIVEAGAERHGSWTILTLSPGERLVIRPGPWGNWTYLAFAGDLQAQHWLGSASTHAISGFGGGRLQIGQRLAVTAPRILAPAPRPIPCPVWARPRHLAHAVTGPQDHHFTAGALEALSTQMFFATAAYDRMGMRLNGPALELTGALSIPSAPILRGSVQVAGNGVATLLMADHQTTGGYPKIATVVDSDTDGLSQLRPGSALRFVPLRPDQAIIRARMARERLDAFLHRIRTGSGTASGRASGTESGTGSPD